MKRKEILGEGSYGQVKIVNGDAVKTLKRISHTIQEALALYYLMYTNTKYCLHIKKVDVSHKKITMPLYDMSLRKYFETNRNGPVEHKMKLMSDVCRGLIEIHDRDLVHGDLKPGNILVNKKGAVLGDCGFVSIGKYSKNERTAALYRETEIEHSWHHDIYSFGICYAEIVGNAAMKHQMNYHEAKEKIRSCNLPNDQKKLVLRMVRKTKEKRPTAREILSKLFNETYDKWSFSKKIFNNSPVPDDDIDSSRSKNIEDMIVSMGESFGISRLNKGFGLLQYILALEKVDEKRDKLYVVSVLLILSSTFSSGKTPFTDNDALGKLSDTPYNKSDMCSVIQKIISNEHYVKILMSPKTLGDK